MNDTVQFDMLEAQTSAPEDAQPAHTELGSAVASGACDQPWCRSWLSGRQGNQWCFRVNVEYWRCKNIWVWH